MLKGVVASNHPTEYPLWPAGDLRKMVSTKEFSMLRRIVILEHLLPLVVG